VASLARSAVADLKTIQEQLGHTSIVLTADTYTSVLTDKRHKPRSHRPARPRRSRLRPQTRQATSQRSHAEIRCLPGLAQAGTRTAERIRATQEEKAASHPHDTQATPTVHKRQNQAMNGQFNGCAARDSNPEPAD